jgi:nitrogen regulatory protein PII
MVEERQVEPLIEAIIDANRTGGLGDGKIFVLPIEESFPISLEEVEVEELEVQRDSLMAEATDASR